MRYDKRVQFYRSGGDIYDPVLGTLVIEESLIASKLCAVYDLTAEKAKTILGTIESRGLMIHHQGPAIHGDAVVYAGQKFMIRATRELRNKASYLVEEVPSEN